eukprot:jgi/Tetstr1/433872/TSEL_023052.t1
MGRGQGGAWHGQHGGGGQGPYPQHQQYQQQQQQRPQQPQQPARRHAAPPQPRGGPPAEDGSVLQADILDFAKHVVATPAEQKVRDRALAKVVAAVGYVYPQAQVQLFGSLPAGMALHNSDMDIVVLNLARPAVQGYPKGERPRVARMLYSISSSMKKCAATRGQHLVIGGARIPIIKCRSSEADIELDISIADDRGCEAAQWQAEMAAAWPALRPLVLALKAFLKQRGLAEVSSGGLGSFALLNMVLAVLVRLPEERDLGTLLAAFLRLFGREFNYQEEAVSVARGGIVSKDSVLYNGCNDDVLALMGPRSDVRLTLEDPLTRREIAGGSHAIYMVQDAFDKALGVLEGVSAEGMGAWDGSSLLGRLMDLGAAVCRPGYAYPGPLQHAVPEREPEAAQAREAAVRGRKRQAGELEAEGRRGGKAGRVAAGRPGREEAAAGVAAAPHQHQVAGRWAAGEDAEAACDEAGVATALAALHPPAGAPPPPFRDILARKLRELPLKSGQPVRPP